MEEVIDGSDEAHAGGTMCAIMAEIIGYIGGTPFVLRMRGIGEGDGLVIHGVHQIDRGNGLPVIGDDGVGIHRFVELGDLDRGLVHGLLGEHLMGDLGADQAIELMGAVFLTVDPGIHFVAQPFLHHIGHLDAEVIADDHALHDEGYGHRIIGCVGDDKAFVRSLDIIGPAACKNAVNSDMFRIGLMIVLGLDQMLHGHGVGAALTVPHEDDLGVLRRASDGFEPRPNGEVHIDHIARGKVHDEVGVRQMGGDTVTEVIGDDEPVALLDEDALQGEAVRRRFGIGADCIMADKDESFGFAGFGQNDLTGQADGIPVAVDAGVGADDLEHFLLVAVLEQLLDDGGRCDAGRLLDLMGTFFCCIFVDGRTVRQVAVVRQTLRKVRLSLTDHLEGHVFRRFEVHEIDELIVVEAAACQKDKHDYKKYF